MKKTVLTIILASFCFVISNAQSSCPVIDQSTFHFVDQRNPTKKRISFSYYNTTNGKKSIVVVVKVKNEEVINDVINISGDKKKEKRYTSDDFTAPNLADVVVEITPHSSQNAGGSACSGTFRSIGGAPLPVSFGSFTATRSHSLVSLKWETLTESNNTGFNIERFNISSNTWESIAFVSSLAVSGNSNMKLSYQYNDNNGSGNITQYRIKQTDFDGKFSYSPVRAVQGQNQLARTVVFPNPSSNGKVTVLYPDATARNIVLFDMTGRIIKEWKNYSNNTLQVDRLNPGMYNLRSSGSQNIDATTERIVIGSI